MTQEIRTRLLLMADAQYGSFSKSLIPECKPLLGVRLPALRKMAQEFVKNKEWKELVQTDGADDVYFEEAMLRGMLIGYGTAKEQDNEEAMRMFDKFVPFVDNWSVCDSFCSGLKLARTHPEPVWEFLQPYFEDPRPFAVRFAVVMLLFYYIDAQHLPRVLALLEEVHSDEYYVKMAVAWAASMCYAAFPDETLPWLQAARLDEFTYRRTIRKFVNLIRSMQSRNPLH